LVNILTISNELTIFDELNLSFSSLAYNFEYADSWDAVVDYFDSDIPDLIFIMEKELDIIFEMLEKLSAEDYENNIPVICFTSENSKEKRLDLFKLGAYDIVHLPILKDELKMLVKKYCESFQQGNYLIEEGMQGRMEDFSVIDLIQTLEEGKKSADLIMRRNEIEGRIRFKDGQIYKAEFRKFRNLEAILNLAGWIRGDFVIEPTENDIDNDVELDNQQILMEAVKRIDARANFLKQLPPIDDVLLISPDTDMHKIKDEHFKFLKFFQGGNTIYNFLIEYQLDELKLIEKLVHFYKKRMLLTHEQFDAYKTDYETAVEQGGIKGMFSRLLKKDSKSKKSKNIDTRKRDKTEIIDPNRSNEVYESVVLMDPVILNEFREKIIKL